MSELSISGSTSMWLHTNIFGAGQLLATYHDTTTHFALDDWLGTKRAEYTTSGLYSTFFSLPYGNGLVSSGSASDATEHHFTGKERDAETGLDYFGARYYGSTMGRFISPEWSAVPVAVPYADLTDPQALNLYGYVRNNPLNRTDPTGHYEVNQSNCNGNQKCQKKYDKATTRFEKERNKDLSSRDARVRAAAAAYGAPGEKNGVHVGFADLRSQGIKGSVDYGTSGKGKLIDVEVQVDINLKGSGLRENTAHEGVHVGAYLNFLTSYDFNSGKYDPSANPTHGQTEFRAFQTGAVINREHGFGPNDTQQILNFLHTDPHYAPVFNQPVFPNNPNFPQ